MGITYFFCMIVIQSMFAKSLKDLKRKVKNNSTHKSNLLWML
jgi:hypothetical protein